MSASAFIDAHPLATCGAFLLALIVTIGIGEVVLAVADPIRKGTRP